MFIPVGSAGGKQVIKVVTKDAEGRVEVEDVMDVRVSLKVCSEAGEARVKQAEGRRLMSWEI
jgi:hypothetical protein